ncbi:MAG: hypothetical protein K5869_01065 [Saccharofermentans sp.]|nr:hypothetical protein [Saccharofermentans sp.]
MIDFSSAIHNNMLYEKVLWIIVPAVLLALIVGFAIWRAIEDRKRKREQAWAAERRKLEVVDGIEERKDDGGKKMRELERARREAEAFAEKAAETNNTLIGGKSEAERDEKEAIEVFGSLGISSKKAEELDRQRDQLVINGYLQKSNTAPIRPVYSNTLEARREQKAELDSDSVGEEANTPALVTDSAAPAKIKPTALKRPTSARVGKGSFAENIRRKAEGEEEEDPMLQNVMRPQIGTDVENAVVERPAEVQSEKPDIMKVGEEAILPAAEKPVKGFKGSEEPEKKAVRHKRPSSSVKRKKVEAKTRPGSGEVKANPDSITGQGIKDA